MDTKADIFEDKDIKAFIDSLIKDKEIKKKPTKKAIKTVTSKKLIIENENKKLRKKLSKLKERIAALKDTLKKSRERNTESLKNNTKDRILAVKKIVNRVIKNEQSAARELKKVLKGDGCCLCGFNKHAALDFHHIDIKTGSMAAMNSMQIIQEIKTCKIVVLCSNCHRQLHAGAIKPKLEGKEISI